MPIWIDCFIQLKINFLSLVISKERYKIGFRAKYQEQYLEQRPLLGKMWNKCATNSIPFHFDRTTTLTSIYINESDKYTNHQLEIKQFKRIFLLVSVCSFFDSCSECFFCIVWCWWCSHILFCCIIFHRLLQVVLQPTSD